MLSSVFLWEIYKYLEDKIQELKINKSLLCDLWWDVHHKARRRELIPGISWLLELINLCLSVRLREENKCRAGDWCFGLSDLTIPVSIRMVASDKTWAVRITNGGWLGHEIIVISLPREEADPDDWSVIDARHLEMIWCQMMSPCHLVIWQCQGHSLAPVDIWYHQWPGFLVCYLQLEIQKLDQRCCWSQIKTVWLSTIN